MFPNRTLLGAAISVCALTAQVQADPVPGKRIKVHDDNTIVTVEFVSADPDRTGNLYFRGSGDIHNVLITAPNTDDTGEGQFLFGNRDAADVDAVQLSLIMNAGDRLHFAFDVIEPDPQSEDVFYSERKGERKQFAWDKHASLLHVDDTRKQSADFDGDYNDMIVRLTFTVIPAPGSVALLGLSALIAVPPRRRIRA